MRSGRSSCPNGGWRCRRGWSPSGWSRRAPRSRRATRSSTSRPPRSRTCSRARSPGRCAGSSVGEGETVPVGALLGVVADASVPDADLDAFVAKFQEEFAAHAAEAGAAAPEPRDHRGRAAGASAIWRSARARACRSCFIHGFGGDLNNWQFNQEALAAGRPPTRSICPATAARARISAPAMSTSARSRARWSISWTRRASPRRIWSAIRSAARSPWTSRSTTATGSPR